MKSPLKSESREERTGHTDMRRVKGDDAHREGKGGGGSWLERGKGRTLIKRWKDSEV